VIGTEVPASERRQVTEGPISTGWRWGGLRPKSDQPEEAPEELVFLTQFAAPPGGRRRGGVNPRRAAEGREPDFGRDHDWKRRL